MKKLNVGCGYVQPEDWVNIDKIDYGQGSAGFLADILHGLPLKDEFFDFVLMNHVLQTFTYNEHEDVLTEVKRVMKPGATLRILVPDFEKALDAYLTAHWDYFPVSNKLEVTFDGKFARYLFWHGETRCAFTEMSLRDLLLRNGFTVRDELGKFGECELDSREEESLIMVAMK